MKHATLALSDLALVAATRAVAGVGLGLLVADHLSAGSRRTIGWALMLVGVFSTVPLAVTVLASVDGTDRAA
jgi:hypothetical protein